MRRGYHGLICVKHVLIGIMAVLCACAATVSGQEKGYYGGGTGDPNDPYQIWTPEQFVAIGTHSEDWASHFRLMADVNFVGMDSAMIMPIGNDTVPFSGVFDGNEFAIENFTFDREDVYDAGIFGVVSTLEMKERINAGTMTLKYEFDYEAYVFEPNESRVHIKNLQIVNVSVLGSRHVGGVAARCFGGIKNCQIKGGDLVVPLEQKSTSGPQSSTLVTGGDSISCHNGELVRKVSFARWKMVGAVVGHLVVGKLEGCDVTNVRIEGSLAGGLVGFSDEATVRRCSVAGHITSDIASGGLIGRMTNTDICRSSADVRIVGEDYNGGLGGAAKRSRICQCYAKGQLEGEANVGGLLGYSSGSLVSDCYARCDVNSPEWLQSDRVGGFIGESIDDSVSQCYCVGQMTSQYVLPKFGGSFIGQRTIRDLELPWIRASFWDGDVSTLDVGIRYDMISYTDNNYPIDDVTSLPTQAMMSQAPFVDAGWNFDTVWAIEEGLGYPVFQWELGGENNGCVCIGLFDAIKDDCGDSYVTR